MSYYASKSRQALYSDEHAGFRTITVPEPGWAGPGLAPLVEVANPACRLPDDAVPISPELRDHLMTVSERDEVIDWSGDLPASLPRPGPPLELLKARRLTTLSAECEAHIVAGFESAALGPVHRYPSKITDQTNLMASVLASLMPGLTPSWATPFWCCDAVGEWGYLTHTAAQIQQVGADGKAAILAALERKALLEAQIAAAATPEAVSAVVWEAED